MTRIRLPSPTGDLAIGIMGGSFDPPHSGHAHVLRTALRAGRLDRIWVLVSPGNPLKATQTPLADRLLAARLRLAGRRIIVTDIESRLGMRYTIDVLTRLKRLAPKARFVWIMGSDNLRDFHTWREWQTLARLVPIIVIARPGSSVRAGLSKFARQFGAQRVGPMAAQALVRRRPPAWTILSAPFDPVSSSALRAQG